MFFTKAKIIMNRNSSKKRIKYNDSRKLTNKKRKYDNSNNRGNRNNRGDTNEINLDEVVNSGLPDGCIGKDWNPNNKLLNRSFVESVIQKFCGTYIRIYDLRKYQLAFVHKSVKKRDISPPVDQVLSEISQAKVYGQSVEPILEKYGTWNNGDAVMFTQDYEQLEFVGDGWIGSIVGDYLYSLFPRQGEGFYTSLKQKIVCTNGLASLSEHLGFTKFLLLSTRNELRYGRDNKTYLEDVFEAFCAAIKQDLGIPMLTLFIKNAIESAMDFEYFITTDTNFKDTLMRFFQSNGWSQPKYPDICERGSMHNKIYTSGVAWIKELEMIGLPPVIIDGVKYVSNATYKSKKDAQKEAARLALQKIKNFLEMNLVK